MEILQILMVVQVELSTLIMFVLEGLLLLLTTEFNEIQDFIKILPKILVFLNEVMDFELGLRNEMILM